MKYIVFFVVLACGLLAAGCSREEKKAYVGKMRRETSGFSQAVQQYQKGERSGNVSGPVAPARLPRRTE